MIYIIRHGQTEGNRKKTLQGRSNYPLNRAGRQQAEGLAAYFREKGISFDAVYTSPLIRARQTADIVAGPDVPVTVDQRLIEIDYGPYEGRSLEDPPEEIITFFLDFVNNPAPEGVEQLDHIVDRMGDFLRSIQGRWGEDANILLSTHAIAMKGGLEYLTPQSKGRYWSTHIANCSAYGFRCLEGEYTLPEEIVRGGEGEKK